MRLKPPAVSGVPKPVKVGENGETPLHREYPSWCGGKTIPDGVSGQVDIRFEFQLLFYTPEMNAHRGAAYA